MRNSYTINKTLRVFMKSGVIRLLNKKGIVIQSRGYKDKWDRLEIMVNYKEWQNAKGINKYYIIIAPVLREDEIEI